MVARPVTTPDATDVDVLSADEVSIALGRTPTKRLWANDSKPNGFRNGDTSGHIMRRINRQPQPRGNIRSHLVCATNG